MNATRGLIALCSIATLLTACGGVSSNGYSPVPNGARAAIAQSLKAGARPNLYVLTTSGYVLVYGPGGTKLRTISQGLHDAIAMAFDRSGNLYVESFGVRHHIPPSITVYAPGASSPVRTISSRLNDQLEAMAFDRLGNLYVGIYAGKQQRFEILVYAAGSTRLLRRISAGINAPVALLFDRSDDLYVANKWGMTVTVYPPQGTSPSLTIPQKQNPITLALDASGNLYVGNAGTCTTSSGCGPGAISVYAPGSASPLATIATCTESQACDPYMLTVDGSGNPYALELSTSPGYVGVVAGFVAGGLSAIRTISETGRAPAAIAFDASGNLYVANGDRSSDGSGRNDVIVYAPGATLPRRTIYTYSQYPAGLAFGP